MHWLRSFLSFTIILPALVAGVPAGKVPRCQIDKGVIPGLPPTLLTPSTKLEYVAVAIGTQNYTCNSTSGTYSNVGAVAELYDISCLYTIPIFNPTFNIIQELAFKAWDAVPSGATPQEAMPTYFIWAPFTLGQHYFVPNPMTGKGLNPKWDFATSKQVSTESTDGFVVAAKFNSTAAPTGQQDIDWVHLKSVSGTLATQVYRTDTRRGQPPVSCTPGTPDIQVKYASKYWLYV